MHQPPPPDARDLLLPLLACLPASFASPRPPPALIPLLSPLLRQRVNYLSTGSSNGQDGWLPLLSWDSQRGSKLPSIVERMDIEPHPVSGELEIEDVPPAKFRRLDTETLHARFEMEQFDLLPVYVWCESDEHGGTGPGWKLTELRSLDDKNDGLEWHDSQTEANDAGPRAENDMTSTRAPDQSWMSSTQDDMDDDNDDYWASYDKTPSRTPAPRIPVAPTAASSNSRSEMDYYNRYGAEVQPALDAHDPDEVMAGMPESTLTGETLFRHAVEAATATTAAPLSMPRPLTPSSSQSSVRKLEAQATEMGRTGSSGGGSTSSRSSAAEERAQLAIKNHISTDIKSLFRLARSAGMDRAEFERVVKTELDVLSLLEQDD